MFSDIKGIMFFIQRLGFLIDNCEHDIKYLIVRLQTNGKKEYATKTSKGKMLIGRGRSLTVVTDQTGTRVHARA